MDDHYVQSIFDPEGHLTSQAWPFLAGPGSRKPAALTPGQTKQAEAARLQAAEHLACCDSCLRHYLAALDQEPQIGPQPSLAASVMKNIRIRNRRQDLNRYLTLAAAACLAIFFWISGVFNINLSGLNGEWSDRFVQSTTQIGRKTGDLSDQAMNAVNWFFDQIQIPRNIWSQNPSDQHK
ncbi:MAG: hypothetical protein VB070_11735 [Clostridiaceae bacterium]|nr:hypothetical protein [Clostridiaceae bacterium]